MKKNDKFEGVPRYFRGSKSEISLENISEQLKLSGKISQKHLFVASVGLIIAVIKFYK